MSLEIRKRLQNSVNSICDCQDCIEGFVCKCGNCEAHYGSLLDVEIISGGNGDLKGIIAIVGVGGRRIELDTRRQQVIGY